MYYNDYEDYMRNVLGYNRNDSVYADDYNSNFSQNYYQMPTYNNINRVQDNVEDLFPDIYKIINPMVCKICKNNTRPITKELVNQMTEEIYTNIEADDINIVNINIETKDSNFSNRNVNQKQVENRELKDLKSQENRNSLESRQRRPNNPLLRDLIKILILNQLLGGNMPGRLPVRPPFPGMPPRPPMRPPFPRPGTRDFGYDDYMNF